MTTFHIGNAHDTSTPNFIYSGEHRSVHLGARGRANGTNIIWVTPNSDNSITIGVANLDKLVADVDDTLWLGGTSYSPEAEVVWTKETGLCPVEEDNP